MSLQQGGGLGGRRTGAQGLEVLVGDPEDGLGGGAAQEGQAAALAEQGQGVLEGVAVGAPAAGGLGVQAGGGLGLAGRLGQDGPGGGGGEAVPGGGNLGVRDQVAGQRGRRPGGDPDHVGQELAQVAAAAGPLGGEPGDLGDQGEGGGPVARGVLDQGRVDQ